MPGNYVELSYWQVALAALLILINAGISLALRLKLERTLLWASLRTVVQLLLVGIVLEWVFAVDRWYIVIGLLAVMTGIAAITAVRRSDRRYPSIWIDALFSIWVSSWLVTAFAMFVVIRDMNHWYQPQYAIPLMGMVLGNTLNGISLGLTTFLDAVIQRRGEIETLLALGATRWEAARGVVQQAVRSGMFPIINSMLIVGLVSLPGMMTGQILAGTAPIEAVKYQIVIMFLIASATALGTVGIVVLSFLRLFSRSHQFLHQRITQRTR